MIKNAEEVYELYKGFQTFIPDWYQVKLDSGGVWSPSES